MRHAGSATSAPQTGQGDAPGARSSAAARRSCSASEALGGVAGAADGRPRRERELVLAVEAVAGVGRRVAAGLAGRDGLAAPARRSGRPPALLALELPDRAARISSGDWPRRRARSACGERVERGARAAGRGRSGVAARSASARRASGARHASGARPPARAARRRWADGGSAASAAASAAAGAASSVPASASAVVVLVRIDHVLGGPRACVHGRPCRVQVRIGRRPPTGPVARRANRMRGAWPVRRSSAVADDPQGAIGCDVGARNRSAAASPGRTAR